LFLYTELLFFGGLFLLYAVYRSLHPVDFHNAATELNPFIGALNTIILLTSSLTVALAISAVQRGNRRLAVNLLLMTVLMGAAFMVNKYFEWSVKIHHGIYPGSPEIENLKDGENLFYVLYFTMTGVHGLHVLVGMIYLGFVTILLVRNPYEQIHFAPHQLSRIERGRLCILDETGRQAWSGTEIDPSVRSFSVHLAYTDDRKDKINRSDITKLENGGLFWHLVDVIWIFLFPLLYLIT